MPPTKDEILKSLLPNDEHILYMGDEGVTLPDWFTKRNDLRIMFASGDWKQNHVPNTEKYSEYDIHTCYPLTDMHTNEVSGNGFDMEKNLQFILDNFYHERLIVMLDLSNNTQISRFTKLFTNSVSEINTLDARVFPTKCHIAARMMYEVLQPNGIIMNAASQCVGDFIAYRFECESRKCTKRTVGGKHKRGKKTQRRRRNLKK